MINKRDPFLGWLRRHLDEVQSGQAAYQGQSVTPDTEVVQFRFVISIILVTFTNRTEMIVRGERQTVSDAILWSLVSSVVGWWGFPWGPIATIGAIITNLTGGERHRVGDLIAEMTGHNPADDRELVRLTEAAADLARQGLEAGGYPPETVLSISASNHAQPEYAVRFDFPETDGRYWLGESQGLGVLVHKKEADRVAGLLIDAEEDEFVFKRTDYGTAGEY